MHDGLEPPGSPIVWLGFGAIQLVRVFRSSAVARACYYISLTDLV